MDKQSNTQLELFSRSKDFAEIKKQTSGNSFFTYIWGYERVILMAIALILTSIISFSLGVERGKGLSLSSHNSSLDLTQETKKQERPKLLAADQTSQARQQYSPVHAPVNFEAIIKPQIPVEKQNVSAEIRQKSDIQSYTIQLASYKTKQNAQKEASQLKKKGLSPLVLYKGSYSVLCVGNFANKERAQARLSEFRKQYRNCYIRRL